MPALVLLGGLSMRLAVGTSLLIIAMKSLTGFYKYIDVLAEIDLHVNWNLIRIFGLIGVAGSLAGSRLAYHIPQAALRKGVAAFLLVMAGFILWQNVGAVLG